MRSAPYTTVPGMIRPTHFRTLRIVLLALGIPLALGAGGLAYLRSQARTPGQEVHAATDWLPTPKVAYAPEPPPEPPPTPLVEDPMAKRWAALQAQLAQMHNDIATLKNRPQPSAAATPPPTPKAPPKKHAGMLYISHEPKDAPPKNGSTPTYTLAPGATKIACHVETVVNSDAGETFTAKTTTPVYDTATGKHLLVPQNSTILGKYAAEGLLYGNERLPTMSLSLTLPNGHSVELSHSPVTNGVGTSGLASTVNQHYGRLLGAVLITGVLRGGTMAMQGTAPLLGVPGQLSAGLVQTGAQTIHQQQSRALDTRPTIMVNAGEPCHVILLKPLTLEEQV